MKQLDTMTKYNSAALDRLAAEADLSKRKELLDAISNDISVLDTFFMLQELKTNGDADELQILVNGLFLRKLGEATKLYKSQGKSFADEVIKGISGAQEQYDLTGVFTYKPDYLDVNEIMTTDRGIMSMLYGFRYYMMRMSELGIIDRNSDVEQGSSITPLTWNGTNRQLGYMLQSLLEEKLIPSNSPIWVWAGNVFVDADGERIENLAQNMDGRKNAKTDRLRGAEKIDRIIKGIKDLKADD